MLPFRSSRSGISRAGFLPLLRRRQGRCYSVRVPPQPSAQQQQPVKTVADLKAWAPGEHVPDVELCGWVRSVRKASGVRFIDVTDGSSMRPVQVVVDKKLAAE